MSNRSFAGKMARDQGNTWEDIFTDICTMRKVRAVRIPNGADTIRVGGFKKLKRRKSPFDFLITKDGLSACVDTKSTAGKTFSHSMIKEHQLKWLQFTGESIPSGYVVWFREENVVVFFDHIRLGNLKRGQSFKPGDGLVLGSSENFKPGLIFNGCNNG